MEFRRVLFRSELVRGGLEAIAEEHDGIIADLRGTGLIQGMSTTVPEAASAITAAAFERGLVIETAGPADEVVKLLPPLIVTDAQIEQALDIIAESTQAVVDQLGDDLVSTEYAEVLAGSSAPSPRSRPEEHTS